MGRFPNGTAMFRGPCGKFVNCIDEDVKCLAENEGTHFKVRTFEDERIALKAYYGNYHDEDRVKGLLWANEAGHLRCSDGNPADERHAVFSIIKREELLKKCWSRLLPKRKPSKIVVEKRQASKSKKMETLEAPPSPGIVSAAEDIDRVLEDNARASSKRS